MAKCCCENPAVSERQRRFMCAELGRKRKGRKTQTTMTESQLRDYCMKKRKRNPEGFYGQGYYVMKWGGGKYTSVAWYAKKSEAEKELGRIIALGAWSGMPPKIELAKRKQNPKRVLSDRQALALTKKVIAYGKKLLMHERSELRRKNPIKGEQVQKFIQAIKETEKYVVGSLPYVTAVAKAYEHLEKIEEQKHRAA